MDTKQLRELAEQCKAFIAADFPIEDPYDTCPTDLWGAWTQPDEVLKLLDELDRLRAFRDYFKDRCEELFAHFGMGPVHLFNATRPYGDGAPPASES